MARPELQGDLPAVDLNKDSPIKNKQKKLFEQFFKVALNHARLHFYQLGKICNCHIQPDSEKRQCRLKTFFGFG